MTMEETRIDALLRELRALKIHCVEAHDKIHEARMLIHGEPTWDVTPEDRRHGWLLNKELYLSGFLSNLDRWLTELAALRSIDVDVCLNPTAGRDYNYGGGTIVKAEV